ncbi:MAG TPA: amino acid permease [Gemmatimonadaceae bacterium]|nr:amino acid permease [Gemmatimonadaceae bacterium]
MNTPGASQRGMPANTSESGEPAAKAPLERSLGRFDATMLVMGGIIGAGIFMNPSVVARAVGTPSLILLAWVLGGSIALAGAFVYAELAVWRPAVGGQYVYLRDAFHPLVAFLYGWTLLLVVQTGGMAAVAVTFASYFRDLAGIAAAPAWIAVVTLGVLTVVNCFGARAGSTVQSTFMVMKIAALLMLVTLGWLGVRGGEPPPLPPAAAGLEPGRGMLLALGAAMVPVLFAYGGWQTASFVSGEMRAPERDLPWGLVLGVLGVVVLYIAVNAVCLAVLGAEGLAATNTPATEVMRRALGPTGAQLIAGGIALSTIGFLSQSMLTAPRVYFAMARDGLFFPQVGRVSARTRAPVIAVALQGTLASVIAVSGAYEQILNYVVSIDALFFGLTGAALLVFRRRERGGAATRGASGVRMPGHPVTTAIFSLAFLALALNTVVQFPRSAGIGVGILLAGVPAYWAWVKFGPRGSRQDRASDA